MNYISLFSGIEAASVAWIPLGFKPIAFSEIDPFCCELLKQKYPDIKNVGDITKVEWDDYAGTIDIVVGGSPCQSFSISGKREGLKGESRLMFEYIRAVQEIMPTYFVWENVPGSLTSDRGLAFRQLIEQMDGFGYGLAWRVLDAQFFGVAQRRRRVFLVGSLRSISAGQILFERESMRWHNKSSKQKRQELAQRSKRSSAIQDQSKSNEKKLICVGDCNAHASIEENLAPTLKVGGDPAYASYAIQARTLRDNIASTPNGAGIDAEVAPTITDSVR